MVSFDLIEENGNCNFSSVLDWNSGSVINSIDDVTLYADNDNIIVGGDYIDDRGKTGKVYVEIVNKQLYLTITLEGVIGDGGV